MKKNMVFLVLIISIISCKNIETNATTAESNTKEITKKSIYKGTGSVTQGLAETRIESLLSCNQSGSRIAGVGEIKDEV